MGPEAPYASQPSRTGSSDVLASIAPEGPVASTRTSASIGGQSEALPRIPGSDASSDELYEVLLRYAGTVRNLQRQNETLKRSLNEAGQDNEEEEDDEDAHRDKMARKEQVREMEDELKRLGRKLCIMHALWLPSSSHLSDIVDAPLPDARPDPLNRYNNAETQLVADRFDYRDIFGERVFGLLSDGHARRQIMRGMNSGRQTMAHRINNQGREKIFPPEVTELPQAQLQRKLGFRPATSRQKVQTWKLYDNEFINSDDYIDEHTPQSIFRGDFMFRTAAGILYGLKGVDALKKGDRFPPSTKKVNARLWGVRTITPGFIATCAVLVLFALSTDDQLLDEGPVSGIPYAEHFRKYFEYLHEGLAGDDDDIVALFADWNAMFFPNGAGVAEDEDEQDEGEQDEDEQGEEGSTRQKNSADGHDAVMQRLREDRAHKRALAAANSGGADPASGEQAPQPGPNEG